MKKLLSLILALAMLLCAVPALADVADDVAAAEGLTHDELVEKAMAESGPFIVAGTTSRITTAAEAFAELYKIEINSTNLKDLEIYTKLESETIDMVMIQDGAQLLDAIDAGIVINYVPASIKDTVSEEDQYPLAHQFTNKVFIYNNKGDDVPAIHNVWDNMNFLIMLTSEKWSQKLADAYKAWKGEDIDLGDYKNAGYKWIAEFLPNCQFGKSDTNIAEEISQDTAAGKIGLFVLSKLRSSSVITENLTPAQYAASAEGYTIEPFAGFMYPIYAMVSANANRPYTAMLFIEYLMTAEGFAPWSKSIGAYSGNAAIPEKEGDLPLSTWKETLVVEDPEFILDNFEVEDFIRQYLQ